MSRLFAAAGIVVAACGATLLAHATGGLERLELLTQDARLASGLGRRPPDPHIVIAWVDQEAIDYARRGGVPFPWPRSMYEQVLGYLRRGGARAVAFDILFTEPGVSAEDDRAFAAALEGSGVTAFKFVRYRDGGFEDAENERMRARGLPAPPSLHLPAERGFALPIPEIEHASARLGFVNVRDDADKTFRRYDLLRTWEGKAYPSLALATAMAATGAEAADTDGRSLRFGDHAVPVDAEGRLQLAFRGGPLTFEHVQFVNIFESITRIEEGKAPIYPAERFKDCIVLVGINAEGYADVLPTPMSNDFPGVELHATALDNLLHGDALRRAGPTAPSTVAAGVLGTLAVFATPGSVVPALVLGLVALLVLATSTLAFASGLLVPTAAPLLAALLAGALSFVWRLTFEGRKRRELKRAFTSYMAPEIVAEVMRDPERIQLGGETRPVTLLFTDLAGFTGLAEHLRPDELVAFLNDYFTRMCDRVLDQHGIIDKFIGDAIMAMFGAPMPQPDHPSRALRAAVAMLAEMQRINAELVAAGKPPVQTRIGLHTGEAVVGNMGSDKRFDYTAIGDTVNLASRLEGANKAFGTFCLVSETTWSAVPDQPGREVGLVRVKGRAQPIRVFEPWPADATRAMADDLRDYSAALVALRRGEVSEAVTSFTMLAARRPDDGVVRRYCQAMRAPDWDGVFGLDEK
ncbi:MAG: adenylate/guanylate cyclase domain-containing protein [Planctomycetota bacterium]